jgi:anti-sigma factor RsiW
MRCSRAIHLLQFYIDQRLPLEQMRTLENHLSDCAACRYELILLETIDHALTNLESVKEPPDLTANIMWRVALTTKRAAEQTRKKEPTFVLLRLSLSELVAVVVLATMTTFGIFIQQPAFSALVPFAAGHDGVVLVLLDGWKLLSSVNSNTLMLCFWLIGTILGVWITLILAGSEMRNLWLKAMMDRLPVW